MMHRVRPGHVLIAVYIFLGAWTIAPPAQAAATTVSGRVMCLNSGWPVGIWVDATTSRDGWASHSALPASGGISAWGTSKWSYSLTAGGTYRLNVGCGGSSASWTMTAKSGLLSGSSSKRLVCNDASPALLLLWKVLLPWKWDLSQGIAYGTCVLK